MVNNARPTATMAAIAAMACLVAFVATDQAEAAWTAAAPPTDGPELWILSAQFLAWASAAAAWLWLAATAVQHAMGAAPAQRQRQTPRQAPAPDVNDAAKRAPSFVAPDATPDATPSANDAAMAAASASANASATEDATTDDMAHDLRNGLRHIDLALSSLTDARQAVMTYAIEAGLQAREDAGRFFLYNPKSRQTYAVRFALAGAAASAKARRRWSPPWKR
jgi:hypothetical protein